MSRTWQRSLLAGFSLLELVIYSLVNSFEKLVYKKIFCADFSNSKNNMGTAIVIIIIGSNFKVYSPNIKEFGKSLPRTSTGKVDK